MNASRPAVAAAIAAVTVAIFAPALSGGFVFDDTQYVVDNPVVRQGITGTGLRWALTTFHASNWHPLAWISHMADVSLFGMNPAGHHLTSILIHAANAALCFLVLAAMTGAPWRSAAVALLFGLHPLRVESVAWVAERKDVLAGLLFLLAVAAWVRYARAPSRPRYALVAGVFALGLAAKPMLVTLPLVLLLLDWWPLGRIAAVRSPSPSAGVTPVPPRRAVLEKAPLLALSAASAVVTVVAQHAGGSILTVAEVPPLRRVGVAVTGAASYLAKAAWPSGLAAVYPLPPGGALPPAVVAASALALATVTAAAILLARSRPQLAVGWLWYLVMLLPVSGLVQVGDTLMADRYTYLPQIGVALALVFLLPAPRGRTARRLVAGGAAVVLAALALASARQIGWWRNETALFTRAVEAVPRNDVALCNLAGALAAEGKGDEALRRVREALGINPGSWKARERLAGLQLARGDGRGIFDILRSGADLPGEAGALALSGLGDVYAGLRQADRAREAYAAAMRTVPDLPSALLGEARLALASGDRAGAAALMERALRKDPAFDEARLALAAVRMEAGDAAGAERELREALRREPFRPRVVNDLGLAVAAAGRPEEALALFGEAARLCPECPLPHVNAGDLLAGLGRPEEAAARYAEALRIDPGVPGVAGKLRALGDGRPR